MTSYIFCPSSHLVLDQPSCEQCGWKRPSPVDLGQPVWDPVELGAGLGGPGRSVFAEPAVAQGVAVFPSRQGELIGTDLSRGEVRWRTPLETGMMTRSLVPDHRLSGGKGSRMLFSLSDERTLEKAEPGALAALDPESGETSLVWQPPTSQLSAPVITEDLILLRTSASELVALRREDQPEIVWKQQLSAWWALPPVVFEDKLLVSDGRAMHGEGSLRAFLVQDGKPLWETPTDGLLARNPVSVGEVIVYLEGRRQLSGIDLHSGEHLWSRDYARLYSNPAADDEHIYIVIRGLVPAGEEGHYLLQALNPIDNELAWEVPLPARVRILKAYDAETLLLGGDDGRLFAYGTSAGTQTWEYSLGSTEDPIHTDLLTTNGYLLAGTYTGHIVALQVGALKGQEVDPQSAFEEGDWQGAADGFALDGDLNRAAEIYSERLGEIEKALQLYEQAGSFRQAADLAKSQGLSSQALGYFERLEDHIAQAEVLLQMGDEFEAAEKFEQAGELSRAAMLYEKIGKLRKAMELYQKEFDIPSVMRLFPKVVMTIGDVDFLEEHGRLTEAAQAAVKVDALERAAKLYQQVGDEQNEYEVLIDLSKTKPEAWSLERLAGLARGKGEFYQEGMAWEKLSRSRKAAEAYHLAARQKEQTTPENENEIAELYQKAADFYAEGGVGPEQQRCYSQVVYYRRLPQIIVSGRTKKAFREEEFNVLEIKVNNVGRGVAREICVQIGGGRFEVDPENCVLNVHSLAPGFETQQEIYLKPEKGQLGEAVPLKLEWTWIDRTGNAYQDQISTPVPVKRLSDTSPLGTPVVIHAQTYIEGTLISGDQVAGDVIEGDQLKNGAQKGDRVEIHRGESVQLHGEGLDQKKEVESAAPVCPNCHLPVDAEANYCSACRFPLKVEPDQDEG